MIKILNLFAIADRGNSWLINHNDLYETEDDAWFFFEMQSGIFKERAMALNFECKKVKITIEVEEPKTCYTFPTGG